MPVVINGHHRLRAMHNNIFVQLPERKIALQGMLNRAHASYQQEGQTMHNNIFLQLDNKVRECKATVYPVGHTHNDIAACVDQWLSGYDKVTSRPVGHTHNDIDKRFSGYVSRTYKHRRCAVCDKFTHKKCSQCLEAYYCGRQCQKLDWRSEHKLCCVEIAN
jgi:hypothetical protein